MNRLRGLLLLCLLVLSARGQDPGAGRSGGLLAELSVAPLPDTLRVGDPFTLSLEARCGEGVQLQWLDPDPVTLRPLHLLKDLGVDTLGPGHFRRTYEAALFEAGDLVVAPFEISVDPGDGAFRLPSDSIRVTVRSVLDQALARGDSLAPRDILDPAPVPLDWRELLPWLLGALVLGVALWVGWRVYKRRPEVQPPRPAEPAPDPWSRWLKRLEAIRAENRWARGETIEYHAELSLALRGLLEDFTGASYREMSHDEVRFALGDTVLPPDLRRELLALLLESDLVKYARQWPSDQRNREALADCAAWGERARRFLDPAARKALPGAGEGL